MFKRLIDTGDGHRIYRWLSYYGFMALGFSLLLNVGLISLIIALFPLKEIKPLVIGLKDKAEQVILVEPLTKEGKGHDLLMESCARSYVLLRETIDLQSEAKRWGHELRHFSSDEVYQAFTNFMDPTRNNESPYKNYQESKTTRSVLIRSVTNLGVHAPNTWQVEWECKEGPIGGETSKGIWVSTLTAETRAKNVNFDDRYLNPLGFTVTHYTLNKKEH